ncbi:MAG: hypothetical protein PHC83_08740, partial [Bacteroidales bacterium]|nr:hypothetical protein [Bacteroidales bacterium]
MRKSRLFLLVLCVVMAFQLIAFTACNNERETEATVKFTDMVGDEVEIPKNPQKVGVLSRSGVDMLIAFGLGDKITGVYKTVLDNSWADIIYPAAVNYYKYDYGTTIETYVEHGVEVVICPEKYLADNLREAGIPAFTVNQYGVPDYDNFVYHFADTIKLIWDDAAVAVKVDSWKAGFKAIKDEVDEKLADVDGTNPKTLYYVRGDKN